MDQLKIFKGCLPQILLGPFLNTLFHIRYYSGNNQYFQTFNAVLHLITSAQQGCIG